MINLQRLRDALAQQEIDLAVLTDMGRVVWVSRHVGFIEKGTDPIAGGPTVALISAQDSLLVTSDPSESNDLQRAIGYTAYDHLQPVDAHANWSSALCVALAQVGGGRGTVGVELSSTPAAIFAVLDQELPHWKKVDVEPLVDQLRCVKTDKELANLHQACSLCDIGQHTARGIACPGMREIEVYSAIHAAMEAMVNDRIPLGADVISGERTLATEGSPGDRVIGAGDLLLTDLFPRHPNGYWGDSCSTFLVGQDPTSRLRAVHRHIRQAMEIGQALLRPGVQACEVDAAVRGHLSGFGYEYPHHSGHGIGVSHFERPYIMPWNNEKLENDMVVALEPGVYAPALGGIRLEWVFRVTDDGGEPLSRFGLDIAQS